MLGMLLSEKECKEMHYLLKKELDEILFDLKDSYLDNQLRSSIEARYQVIFRMYARIATNQELARYVLNKRSKV